MECNLVLQENKTFWSKYKLNCRRIGFEQILICILILFYFNDVMCGRHASDLVVSMEVSKTNP